MNKETIKELMKDLELTKPDLVSIYDRNTGEKILDFELPLAWFDTTIDETYEYEYEYEATINRIIKEKE